MKLISKEKAYYITTLWGSYIRSGDPGACLYGFPVDDARPQNEQHRRACIAYVSGLMERNYKRITNYKQLKSLRRWFEHCELMPPEALEPYRVDHEEIESALLSWREFYERCKYNSFSGPAIARVVELFLPRLRMEIAEGQEIPIETIIIERKAIDTAVRSITDHYSAERKEASKR